MSFTEQIIESREKLESWLESHPSSQISLRNFTPAFDDFSKLNLERAKFEACDLTNKSFAECNLANTQFPYSTMHGAIFTTKHLNETNFSSGKANAADFKHAIGEKNKFINFTGPNCEFNGAILKNSDFSKATLRDADFRNSVLHESNFSSAVLEGADLRDADLRHCVFTMSQWKGARINSRTKLDLTEWSGKHRIFEDGQVNIITPWWARLVRWNHLRIISRLPLFSGSSILLTLSLAAILSINWINRYQFVAGIDFPVPIPAKLNYLLAGSLLLTIGAALYESLCPERIKQFGKLQWAEQVKRPYVLYISDSIKRPAAITLAMLFSFLGGSILVCLLIERIFLAVEILLSSS